MRRALTLALGPVLFCSCFYPLDRGKQLETRLDSLSAENQKLKEELQASQARVDQTLPKIDAKIAEVTQAMELLDKAARRSGADIGVQLQKTVEDVAQLRGQVETYLHKISTLEESLKRVQEETERRFAEAKADEEKRAADAKKRAEELKRPANKQEFLALAGSKAKDGDLPLARQLYSEFLKKWPKDALVGEAHFGLGETYFAEGKCREALYEYGLVVQHHGKTQSAPDAFLRSSECFKKLGKKEEERIALEELVKAYPKSQAAKTAKARLDALDKAQKKKPAKARSKAR